MITLYKILKDEYGEGKNDECCIGEFKTATELLKELSNKGITISKQAISQAIKNGYVVKEKYLLFKNL